MNELKDIDDLIAKVLCGEASPNEILQLEDWKKANKKNQNYFDGSKLVFERITSLKETVNVNADLAWKKLDTRLSTEEGRVLPLFTRRRVLQAAASLFLLVSLGFLLNWLLSSTSTENMELSTTQEVKEQNLPDGSKVVLNKNSSLAYALTKKNIRQVKLKGSAHFEVVHNEEKPFIIEVDEVLIKDIGTAFDVKAMPESELIEVSVEEGIVQFYTENSNGLLLVKGEKATYHKKNKNFNKLSPSTNKTQLKPSARRFNFENTPLSEVVEAINSAYNSDIRLENPSIGSCRLSVSFNEEQLEVLLSVIAETLNLSIKQQGSTILLQGEACSQ